MHPLKYVLLRAYTLLRHPSTLIYFNRFRKTIFYPGVSLKGASHMKITDSVFAKGCAVKSFGGDDEIIIDKSYFGDRAYISSKGRLTIRNASFAPNVFIGTYKHALVEGESDSGYSVSIDSPKFIGQNVSIFGNVSVGKGSVIGACSVVTKNIEPFCMYVGNPARKIKTYSREKNEWVRV